MVPIQLLLLAFLVFAALRTVRRFHQKRIAWSALVLWLLIWTSIAVVVIYPDIASYAATMLGVGRGADLVTYLAIVALFFLVFRCMASVDTTEQEITKIVTTLALKDIPHDKP